VSRRGEGPVTARYLEKIGVRASPRATCPFDPGYDPGALEGHMQQSGHLMGTVKISMACWMVADEGVSRRKIKAVTELGIPAVAGGGPFEVAVAQGALPD
jgi:phosphosulfolactate synthase (CoM biosynthesis protein A)